MARFYEKLTKPTALADGDIFVISVGSGTSWIDYKITYSQLKDVIKTISDMQNYYTKSQTYTQAEVNAAISSAIGAVYKPSGSKTCAELVSSLLISANKGNVYNITDSGVTTEDFVDGAGKTINAGDNVSIVEVSTDVFKFDLLSGFIDLTGYQTKNLASAIEGQTTVEGALAALSANKANLSEVYTKTQINDDFVKKSATAGLLKNDGSVDTNTYVPAVTGKGLSTEDYTSPEKAKLAGISDGATKTESSLTNGHIEIDDVDVTVYDDTALDSRVDVVEQDLSTDTATVTGNPLNFSTLTAQKAVETVISLEPIQDLHGYDHPWPVGGGKNKLQVTATSATVNGVTFTVNDNGSVLAQGTSTEPTNFVFGAVTLSPGTYIMTGCPDGGSSSTYRLQAYATDFPSIFDTGNGVNFNIENEIELKIRVRISNANVTINSTWYPMIRLATETDPTFAPYSNICPIDGRTETSLVGTNGKESTDPDYIESNNLTIQFGEKVYGATVELEKGTVTVEWGYIASYNGETLPGEWISDRDVYAPNTSPSTGAEVAYELATPRTITLTPNEISLLSGVNVISTDGDGIKLTYRDGKVATLGDLDSLNVALNDALQSTTTALSEDITTAQNTANTALAYAQNKVYGMRIRESVESNPASIISYLADAVGMTPAHMDYTNNVFDYGSWEDAWFIKDCKPCILGQDGVVQAYLNKNDYTKDIYGNTVTIDENLTGANVMIEFPKIWYKIVPVVPTCCDADIYFSPVKLDDDYKDFAYIAQDKTHKEHFYLPAYNGSIINDGMNDVLRSLSGQAVGNSKTGTVEIEMAQRNGTGWYTETFSQVTLINLLLMLIGKSTDTQTVFGRGIDTGSQTAFNAYRTGAGNTKGMFWGSNDGTQLVKVFGIENWWALQWRRFGGLMCVNGTFKYKMCWGQEDGSTTDNYNTDASGYIESPSPAPSGTSGGYISRMFFTSVNMLMSVIGGSSSTKYCDGGWFNNSDTRYAFRGGTSGLGALCGAFALLVSAAVSGASWYLGAALSYT